MLLTFLLLSSTAVFAHTEKGEILLDADFGFHMTGLDLDTDPETTIDVTQLDMDLQAGYMVIDSLEIMGVLSIDNISMDIEADTFKMENSESLIMFSVGTRYFLCLTVS